MFRDKFVFYRIKAGMRSDSLFALREIRSKETRLLFFCIRDSPLAKAEYFAWSTHASECWQTSQWIAEMICKYCSFHAGYNKAVIRSPDLTAVYMLPADNLANICDTTSGSQVTITKWEKNCGISMEVELFEFRDLRIVEIDFLGIFQVFVSIYRVLA